MSERKIDLSKVTDFEIAQLIAERDIAHFRMERLDELLSGIGQAKGFEDAAPGKNSVDLPGVDLSNLPWKSYATKEAAKPTEAAWIFKDTHGTESLLAILKTKDKAKIGSFEYSLSGQEKQFISRKLIKEKT
ncbi:MAG: hypothetical protein ABSA79_02535 [Candidatus Bathyarchaeia archaeon]